MKNRLIFCLLLFLAHPSFAQIRKVAEARDWLAKNNYQQALPLLDAAVKNKETKKSAEAWYLRGMAYLQQAIDTTVQASGAAHESYLSLLNALQLDPDYNAEINNGLYTHALLAFNRGTKAFQSNPLQAYDAFKQILEIYQIGGGTRFKQNEAFNSLVMSARLNAAYSALNAQKTHEALSLCKELKNVHGSKDTNVYLMLAEIFQRQHDEIQWLAILKEAQQVFPSNRYFRNQEINYYIAKKELSKLKTKLEESINIDKENAELYFNLGNVYYKMLFPKDESGKDKPRPANHLELYAKAEHAFTEACRLQPGRYNYLYNTAILYYESAAQLIRQMIGINGEGPEEQQQYARLLKQRDEEFAKAIPYFENAYTILDAKSDARTDEEKIAYKQVLTGLREIAVYRKEQEKAQQYKEKLEQLKRQ